MTETTRQQLEILTKRKEALQKKLSEINFMTSMFQCSYLHNAPHFGLMPFDGYEYLRRSLLYQLYDIQNQIDELQTKN